MSSTDNGREESQYIGYGDDFGISMNEFIKKKTDMKLPNRYPVYRYERLLHPDPYMDCVQTMRRHLTATKYLCIKSKLVFI